MRAEPHFELAGLAPTKAFFLADSRRRKAMCYATVAILRFQETHSVFGSAWAMFSFGPLSVLSR